VFLGRNDVVRKIAGVRGQNGGEFSQKNQFQTRVGLESDEKAEKYPSLSVAPFCSAGTGVIQCYSSSKGLSQ
jgi:hypothetical protein